MRISSKMTAHFQGEAWIADQAVAVTPEGPDEWDCTAFARESREYLARLPDGEYGIIDNDDVFKSDPAAPEWVRTWTGPFTIRITSAIPTEQVKSSQLCPGDVVCIYGMRVRVDNSRSFPCYGHGHPASTEGDCAVYSYSSTVLNLAEVKAARIVPPSFMRTEKWEQGRGWVTDREDHWTIQGNDHARWTREIRAADTARALGGSVRPPEGRGKA